MLEVMESRKSTPRAFSRSSPVRRKKNKAKWWSWWPLVLGVAVTPLARRAAAVLAMEGPGALQMLYPYVALLKLRVLSLPEELVSDLSQILMYVQFPLYGLFMALLLRAHGTMRAVAWTVLVHAVPLGALMVVASV